YATADLEIPAGDDTLRAALDPLQQPQPRISIAVTRDLGAQARTFDLGVREILETASGRTWRIRLASDEAAAAEWSSPQEIGGGTTIRAVIANMTSGTGTGSPGPGTSIAATPAWDADVNVTADAENAWTDPRLVTLALTGGGCTATRSGSWPGVENGVTLQSWRLSAPTSSDSFLRLHADEASLNGHAVGERWMYSADLNIEVTQSGTGHYRARRLVAFLVVNGTTQEVQSQEVTLGTAGQTDRAVLEFTVPLGTTAVFVRAYHGYTVGTVRWGKIRASRIDASPHRFIPIPLDPGKVRYDWFFTGSDTDTALYDYGWTGKADESASRRRALTDIRPEAVWREAGELGWPKIAALLQTKGWRLVCDETRTWTIRDDTDTTPGTLVLKDTTAIIDADTTTSRDDDTWFDSARVIYAWESGGIPYTITEMYVPREDGDYLPMTKTRTIQVDGPYPGPGRAKAAVQRAQRRGRRITTRSLTDWTVTPSQAGEITIGTTVSTGRVQRVEWDLADDSMRCEIAIGA
ncbi:MAG: hypothetical protein JSS74_11990, partial [Actinobacteria bacterium]|nr:hypothetical protein [Actinomycetota bacterium]